jgi:GntR family transcriptional regulator/MocR family aminotransferase
MIHFVMPRSTWMGWMAPRQDGETAQGWIHRSLREASDGGLLRQGAAVPSTRALATHLGVARGTVIAAYEQLAVEGYLESRGGSGTRVSVAVPPTWPLRPVPRPLAAPRRRSAATLAAETPLARVVLGPGSPFPAREVGAPRALAPHQPDVREFPVAVWQRLHTRCWRRDGPALMRDAPPQGDLRLRQAIASYVAVARGVKCDPAQVVVVASVQQGLDLVARLALPAGASVWMEDPGYVGARRVLEACGADVRPVAVDEDGLDIGHARAIAPAARLAYVTPSRQAPLGVALSLPRRRALLEHAARTGMWIFEDDYDSEYRFNARPIPALKAMDTAGRVLLAGSFGKLLFPGLRVSYLVLPEGWVEPVATALSLAARHVPLLPQRVLATFMEEGWLDRHVRRMRRVYAARAECLSEQARRHWDGLLQLPAVQAGLDTVGRLAPGHEAGSCALRLRRAGVHVHPLSSYACVDRLPPALVMGFAAYSEAEIAGACQAIGKVLSAPG